MEKEQKYLQKDILRMIFQMRKCRCEEKLIKRMIITEHDLTDYRWKSPDNCSMPLMDGISSYR